MSSHEEHHSSDYTIDDLIKLLAVCGIGVYFTMTVLVPLAIGALK